MISILNGCRLSTHFRWVILEDFSGDFFPHNASFGWVLVVELERPKG